MQDKIAHDPEAHNETAPESNRQASTITLLDSKYSDVEAVRNDARRHVARALVLVAEALGLTIDGGGSGGLEARKLGRAIAFLGRARGDLEVLDWEIADLVACAQREAGAGGDRGEGRGAP